MADRFPSLEDFDSGAQTDAKGTTGESDAAAGDDFLARERAALGDDATQFTTSNDNAAFVEDDDDDLLGGGDSGAYGGNDMNDFQSSFPEINTINEAMAPGGSITGNHAYSSYTAPSSEPEAEVITQWRERRNLALADRAEKSEAKKQETIKAAQQNIDDFYENYNNKKQKTIDSTRADEKSFLEKRDDTTSGGTSWERIAKLVDLSGKGAKGGAASGGKDRFRELLVSLKKDEKAPGASGV